MKRTRTSFDFNFSKGRHRGMIKTKYRDNMRTTIYAPVNKKNTKTMMKV